MSFFNLFKRDRPSLLDTAQITKPDEAQLAIDELQAKTPNAKAAGRGLLGSFGGELRK